MKHYPELKIKLKSLAAESRIIRREELIHFKAHRFAAGNSLHLHRVDHVRPIARATHIAYGLLRGREYHDIEPTTNSVPMWHKVEAMIKKYGTEEQLTMYKTGEAKKAA